MNIVKLKDIIKPNDEFFNTYLKGKYAWWVHMRYIIPFEKMGIQGYIACEENIRLAYRNIKRNQGSFTAGMDKVTIKDIEKLPAEKYVEIIQRKFKWYKPKKDKIDFWR